MYSLFRSGGFFRKSNLKKSRCSQYSPNIKNENLGKLIPLGSKNNFKWITQIQSLAAYVISLENKISNYMDLRISDGLVSR